MTDEIGYILPHSARGVPQEALIRFQALRQGSVLAKED